MGWVQILPLLLHPPHSTGRSGAVARGQTTKVVHCEGCGQNYAYKLKRTGRGSAPAKSPGQAVQEAEANLRWLLATEIEPIPCPACGRYQSHMIPEAQSRRARWMLYVGCCLTIGIVPVVVCSGLLTGFQEPTLPAALACVFALGIGMLVGKYMLSKNYDPNDGDDEARRRYGQYRAILLSEQEARDLLAHPGAYERLGEGPVVWIACAFAILLGVGLLGLVGYVAVRAITRASVPGRFDNDLPAYLALMPKLPPEGGVEQPRRPGANAGKVRAKMVVVNVTERRIDDLHLALPDDLGASRPEEVATVVLLTWEKRPTSTEPASVNLYGNRFMMIAQVKVFDWERKAEIASGTFFGDLPDFGQAATGPKPDARVLKYLTDLPRE
jgi:hypothetical protein